jgi:hypothetical protein
MLQTAQNTKAAVKLCEISLYIPVMLLLHNDKNCVPEIEFLKIGLWNRDERVRFAHRLIPPMQQTLPATGRYRNFQRATALGKGPVRTLPAALDGLASTNCPSH